MQIFINTRNNNERKCAKGCYIAGVICLIYGIARSKVRDARQLATGLRVAYNLFQLDQPPVSVVVQCKQRGALPAVLFVQRRGFIRDIIATS